MIFNIIANAAAALVECCCCGPSLALSMANKNSYNLHMPTRHFGRHSHSHCGRHAERDVPHEIRPWATKTSHTIRCDQTDRQPATRNKIFRGLAYSRSNNNKHHNWSLVHASKGTPGIQEIYSSGNNTTTLQFGRPGRLSRPGEWRLGWMDQSA